MRIAYKKLSRKIKKNILSNPFLARIIAWHALYKFSTTDSKHFKYVKQMFFMNHYDDEYRNNLIDSIKNDPECRAILDQRVPVVIKPKLFKNFSENTLGYHYYHFVLRNKISLLHYRERHFKKSDDYTYITLRIMCTHDIYHVLLGQETHFLGEGFIAGFTIAQLPAYIPPSIHLSGGFLNLAKFKTHSLDEDMQTIFKGWINGLHSKQLFTVDWNTLWNEDIDQIRESLSINTESITNKINTLIK